MIDESPLETGGWRVRRYHDWDVSPVEAASIQKRLAQKIVSAPLPAAPRRVAGCDISYSKGSDQHLATAVVLSFPDLKIIEQAHALGKVSFPYVPGLLSFREVPLLIQAFARLNARPDLIICDGQGIAHPRRIGLASHLGLVLDVPAVGAAKSRLCGRFETPGWRKGSQSPLLDRGKQIGTVLRTKDNVSPIFVSLGHRITLEEAVCYVLACATRYRMPEPTRLAHKLANALRIQGGRALPSHLIPVAGERRG